MAMYDTALVSRHVAPLRFSSHDCIDSQLLDFVPLL